MVDCFGVLICWGYNWKSVFMPFSIFVAGKEMFGFASRQSPECSNCLLRKSEQKLDLKIAKKKRAETSTKKTDWDPSYVMNFFP